MFRAITLILVGASVSAATETTPFSLTWWAWYLPIAFILYFLLRSPKKTYYG